MSQRKRDVSYEMGREMSSQQRATDTSTGGPAGRPAAEGATATIRAVERAIAVLFAFSRENPSLGVSELAEKLDLTKSTVHRLLQVLLAHGLVAQDPIHRQYTLGYRVLALSHIVPGEADLRDICLPHMRRLRAATDETVALYGPAGNMRVCLEELESQQMLRMSAGVGRTFLLDRGAASYALLMDAPGGELWRRTAAQLPPERQERLLEIIERAQRAGYAVSSGETVAGAASIAAPIRDTDRAIVAALSVGGPSARFTDDAIVRHVAALREAVAEIERDLAVAATWHDAQDTASYEHQDDAPAGATRPPHADDDV